MASNESTVQDRLGEELGLLPGRISRYFFLLATLDAQASRIRTDLQQSRSQWLGNLQTVASSDLHQHSQLGALHQLHLAQRQLLADKLFVDKKASEWLERAKHVVNRCNQESTRRRYRTSDGRVHVIDRTGSLFSHLIPESFQESRQRRRLSFEEHVDSTAPFNIYGLRTSESPTSIPGEPSKRRRTSSGGEFIAPGRLPLRKSGEDNYRRSLSFN